KMKGVFIMSKNNKTLTAMIEYSKGDIHDITHLLKVYTYARLIGEEEGLSANEQEILNVSAIVHDISCPTCRIKYGNTTGNYQERESRELVVPFLQKLCYSNEIIERVTYVVENHHTYSIENDLVHRILLEADFIVNAEESGLDKASIEAGMRNIFKTKTGKQLIENIYLND
ncbi:HD domain-containing protein, partial [Erysipelotrichaceae bacterium OttesenSCG-928-M19]|nr:HD domain-containing protein [Erysipelotrichaceae bacterium OttesenSCG-928-M19]